MPRQRIHHTRETYNVLGDFPERLADPGGIRPVVGGDTRRLGVHPYTMRQWVLGRARPSMRYMMALLELAEELGLRHIFTD